MANGESLGKSIEKRAAARGLWVADGSAHPPLGSAASTTSDMGVLIHEGSSADLLVSPLLRVTPSMDYLRDAPQTIQGAHEESADLVADLVGVRKYGGREVGPGVSWWVLEEAVGGAVVVLSECEPAGRPCRSVRNSS